MESRVDALREEMKAEATKHRQEADKLRAEVFEARLSATKLREQQVTALQLRLAALHTASLLSDDELFSAEDAIIDSEVVVADGGGDGGGGDGGATVQRMLLLSQRSPADASFARQLRRMQAK